MEARQVFSAYDRSRDWSSVEAAQRRYCPRCGGELRPRGGQKRPVCPGCGLVRYRNPLPGVVVVARRGDSILLGKRAENSFRPGLWCLPGGFIEHEEDFLTAAVREVKEESGLDIRIGGIISVVSNFLSPELHTLVVVLLAEVVGGTAAPADDLVELAWFSPGEPLPEMAFEADRHIIARYFATRLSGAPVDPRYSGRRAAEARRCRKESG